MKPTNAGSLMCRPLLDLFSSPCQASNDAWRSPLAHFDQFLFLWPVSCPAFRTKEGEMAQKSIKELGNAVVIFQILCSPFVNGYDAMQWGRDIFGVHVNF